MATSTASVTHECTVCPKKTDSVQRCEDCKVTYFCSTQCQRLVYKTHKLICNKLDPRPVVFTQPYVTNEERDYVTTEFDSYEKGSTVYSARTEYGPLDVRWAEPCTGCGGCENTPIAFGKFLDELAPALLFRYDRSIRSTRNLHMHAVFLRATLHKIITLDDRHPKPSVAVQSLWALASYEMTLAADLEPDRGPTEVPHIKPFNHEKYRLAIDLSMRQLLIVETLIAESKKDPDNEQLTESKNLSLDRLASRIQTDSQMSDGGAVTQLYETWCRRNGLDKDQFLLDFGPARTASS